MEENLKVIMEGIEDHISKKFRASDINSTYSSDLKIITTVMFIRTLNGSIVRCVHTTIDIKYFEKPDCTIAYLLIDDQIKASILEACMKEV